jgi:ComF family protein
VSAPAVPEQRAARECPGLRWPNRCAVCRSGTRGAAGRLCEACVLRHAPRGLRCPRCALARSTGGAPCGACLRAPPPWDAAVALADYGYPWDGLLAALKFRAALDLVPALADRLAQRVTDAGSAAVDLVVPVPLSAGRLRERGYNQAALLAERLAARLRRPCAARLLARPRDTAQQLALPRAQREANVRDAFAVAPRAADVLHGRRVALVDDVLTTGATLGEATRALLGAGAAEVRVWVVARTPD